MFEKIDKLLNELSNLPNYYISRNVEYVLEPMLDNDVKDYIKFLRFSIIERGVSCYDNLVYRANCKENNPKVYLEKIYNDLLKIYKKNYKKDYEEVM